MEEIKMVVIGEKTEYLTTDRDIENVLMQNGIDINGNNIQTKPENNEIMVEMPVVFQIDKENLSKVKEYLSVQGIEIEESRDVLKGKIEEEKACLKEKIEKYSDISANMALITYKAENPDEFKIGKYTLRKGKRKKEIEELEKKIKDGERDKIKNYYQNIAKDMKKGNIEDIYISERDHFVLSFNLETKYEALKGILKDTLDYANEDRAFREDYLENGLKNHLEIAVLYRLVMIDMLKHIFYLCIISFHLEFFANPVGKIFELDFKALFGLFKELHLFVGTAA